MKIKVDMTPNPLDLQTLHCSQGDTEERKFQFVLHSNGELYDLSNISGSGFQSYPVAVGGTEQLLPENGASPTTSPILADIQYPDGLQEGQEFTYREVPTATDGNASIQALYGNSLVWNQLVDAPTSVTSSTKIFTEGTRFVSGHKYYFSFRGSLIDSSGSIPQLYIYLRGSTTESKNLITGFGDGVVTFNTTITANGQANVQGGVWFYIANYSNTNVSSICLYDLTQMGLDSITDPSEFTSLFPMSYYDYNAGTLISFVGTGIKTTGKNLLNARATFTTNGITFTNDNGVITINGTATANAYFTTNIGLRNGSYFIGAFNDEINNNVHVSIRNESGAYPIDMAMSSKNRVASLNNDINRFLIYVNSGATLNNFVLKPMISFENSEYFEPYAENTTNLPTLTYFPNGMRSAGDIYDELTPSKAITRVGSVDMGTLNWIVSNGVTPLRFEAQMPSDYKKPTTSSERNRLICSKYSPNSSVTGSNNNTGITNYQNLNVIFVRDLSYSDATTFKQAMTDQNVKLYYELATPTEETFTSATLVTKNGDATLYRNGDVLECECNEDISRESGYFDAKIALTDDTGTNYSNKFQIIVERSPE